MERAKLVIYYFSGTGNARAVAHWLAEGGKARRMEAEVLALESLPALTPAPPSEGQLTAFVFPTHGFSPSPRMLSFIARFPTGKGEVMLLNTRGGTAIGRFCLPGLSGMALYLPAAILLGKGYRIVGMWPVDMPSNWLSLHPALRGGAVARILARCRQLVTSRGNLVFQGRRVIRGFSSLPVDLLLMPVALIYLLIGRYALAKTFIATGRCNSCGLCVRQCPTGSLVMVRERPWWRFSCESCMRCMNICPERAIETSHGFSLLLWTALVMTLPPICFGLIALLTGASLPASGFSATLGKLIVYAGPGLLTIALGYRLLHRSMRLDWVAWLVSRTSLTRLSWWGRYLAPVDRKAPVKETIDTEG